MFHLSWILKEDLFASHCFTMTSIIIVLGCFCICLASLLMLGRANKGGFSRNALTNASSPSVHYPVFITLHVYEKHVMIDNGILQLTLSKPSGNVTGINYNGVDNLMEVNDNEYNGGFWDVVWSEPGKIGTFDLFIVLGGSSGFYSYGIFEHLEGWPDFDITQLRIVFRPREDMFHYMALSDDKQRIMPMYEDRLPGRGQPLAYKEAVLLVNPINPNLKGEVDDKYEYAEDNKDNQVHGWISSDPQIGFWLITPSNEFKTGGPFMRDLTSHVGPFTLAKFTTTHYAGGDLVQKYRGGEYWKKVFGPVYTYVNSDATSIDPRVLWNDAKIKMKTEVKSWPYDFPRSKDYPTAQERGSVTGKLCISERLINKKSIPADSAYVGLALPGEFGSWQKESKGYQFWVKTDEHGCFTISNVRTGEYNLYAYVPGFIGDYKMDANITITEGCSIDLGDLVYEPPRDGPTIWEIGIPDRSAAEFFVPDANPLYLNRLYVNHPEKYRQYGLWERYAELYPENDLVYNVGESNYTKDWFFAQVTRKGDNGYLGTTWEVRFQLKNVNSTGAYMLRVALASASRAELQVRVNDLRAETPHFSTGVIGQDNSIARHGIHGLYWLYSIDVSKWVVQGSNTIYLTQPRSTGPFQGLMYDYLRLEGPSEI